MDLKKLREIRKSKGITQAEMAQRLGYKGKSGYCQLEKGQVNMTLEKASRICEVLGAKMDDIFIDNMAEKYKRISN